MKPYAKLTINGSLPALNEANNSARTHWSLAAKMKKDATNLVKLQCGRLAPITEPILIGLVWYYSGRHDFDNIRSAVKFVLDGMVASGKLPNDNQTWVRGFVGDIFVKVPKGQEKVVVELYNA